MKFVGFPSIENYSSYIKGQKFEEMTFVGTVKVHGTNAAISEKDGEFCFQSRDKIIDAKELHDNFDFAFEMYKVGDYLKPLFAKIREMYDDTQNIVTLFGEWAGDNIQRHVAISQVQKFFAFFALKIGDTWHNVENIPSFPEYRIFNIFNFGKWEITISPKNWGSYVEQLEELTLTVENKCPVAYILAGIEGIGEGIVWSAIVDGKLKSFKTKGSKHHGSKDNKTNVVKKVKRTNIDDFMKAVFHDTNRYNQAVEKIIRADNKVPDTKYVKDINEWIMKDILKEELEMFRANPTIKVTDVMNFMGPCVRDMFRKEFGI